MTRRLLWGCVLLAACGAGRAPRLATATSADTAGFTCCHFDSRGCSWWIATALLTPSPTPPCPQ